LFNSVLKEILDSPERKIVKTRRRPELTYSASFALVLKEEEVVSVRPSSSNWITLLSNQLADLCSTD